MTKKEMTREEYCAYADKVLYGIFDAQRGITDFSIETGKDDFDGVRSYLKLAKAELDQVVKEKAGDHD